MHKYFVSYAGFAGTKTAFGSAQITLAEPIRSHEDISVLAQGIKENNKQFDDVVVLNWKRFEAD